MKNKIKSVIKSTILSPPTVTYCSQTIYQALLFTVRMYKNEKSEYWLNEVNKLVKIMTGIQRPDGGFDIGYDFNFGLLHKKGDSTSPEMYAAYALVEAYKVTNSPQIKEALEKAKHWIEENAVYVSDDEAYTPYSPYNTKDVMVYNGTSFALGAYSSIGQVISIDTKLEGALAKYLCGKLVKQPEYGLVWFYNDQDRMDLTDLKKDKIDFYHQAQQIEMHLLYIKYSNKLEQLPLIKDAFMSLVHLSSKESVLPYANDKVYFDNNIHVWGLSSFIAAYADILGYLTPQDAELAEKEAKKTADYLLNVSFKNDYFIPTLKQNNRPFDERYMVRSDAWVINSLSNYNIVNKLTEEDFGKLIRAYNKMTSANFSGIESHASNARVRMFRKIRDKLTK
ncbi:hypothetical protein [Vibrio owensii]|uniref:hypothetical protein n=1 Tax=Vibrio owensii TaxID=696485 RepID=UPI002F3EFAC0